MSHSLPRRASRRALRGAALCSGYAPTLLLALLGACSSSSATPSSDSSGGSVSSLGGAVAQLTGGSPNGGATMGGTSASSGGSLVTSTGGTGATDTGGSSSSGGSSSDASGSAGLPGGGQAGAGQSAGGSSGSAGNQAGGGSGGASADCGINPVTPNATAATHKVLCYLHSIYGNHILSGQEENNDDNSMNTIVKVTGKYPAIRAFDVNNSMAPSQCVAQWKAGGLCMFGYHMDIDGKNFDVAENIDNVLKSGTSENSSFNQDLDRFAQYIQPLQQAGGVAIVRLFHEAGKNCQWFWWTKGTSQQWQQLFKYAFNYLTATKGLNNILWIAPLCGSPDAAYNPGTQYIDMGGADDYVSAGDYEPLTNLFKSTQSVFPNMMVALHECGAIPDPDQLKSSGTKWLFFNVWSGDYINSPNNSTDHLKAVYSSDYVLTRDELPSFK